MLLQAIRICVSIYETDTIDFVATSCFVNDIPGAIANCHHKRLGNNATAVLGFLVRFFVFQHNTLV
jgi:hypothetical protein